MTVPNHGSSKQGSGPSLVADRLSRHLLISGRSAEVRRILHPSRGFRCTSMQRPRRAARQRNGWRTVKGSFACSASMKGADAVDHVGLGVVAHARAATVPFGPPSTAIAPASMPALIDADFRDPAPPHLVAGSHTRPRTFSLSASSSHYGQPPRPLGNKQRCVIGTITFPTPDCANNAPFASM
jgi:hypothetical protein